MNHFKKFEKIPIRWIALSTFRTTGPRPQTKIMDVVYTFRRIPFFPRSLLSSSISLMFWNLYELWFAPIVSSCFFTSSRFFLDFNLGITAARSCTFLLACNKECLKLQRVAHSLIIGHLCMTWRISNDSAKFCKINNVACPKSVGIFLSFLFP